MKVKGDFTLTTEQDDGFQTVAGFDNGDVAYAAFLASYDNQRTVRATLRSRRPIPIFSFDKTAWRANLGGYRHVV